MSPETSKLDVQGESRRLLFISHANPEDNAAASWFATQLTRLGYEVWCDLRSEHKGESDFWLKVQRTIENEAAKFIFVLSETSRDFAKKTGVYKEAQAASNLHRENFIIPLRIEPLTGSVPIIIGTGLYINSENWAEGLRQLHERLIEDDIPRTCEPDYEKIVSWWPALGVERAIVRDAPSEMVSNLLALKELPENIHLIQASMEGNPIVGYERLAQALSACPPYYAHGDYAISFARARDFCHLSRNIEVEDKGTLSTSRFIEIGDAAAGVIPQTARNIVTFLVASTFEQFLAKKGLRKKPIEWSRRGIWYPTDGLIDKNKFSISEPGRRKRPIQLVGTVKYYTKKYMWHLGVQPRIDIYTFPGILLIPKAILTRPYKISERETPVLVDEKKVLKKLGWWNKEWRQRLFFFFFAFTAWLSEGQDAIKLPTGYQDVILSGSLEVFVGGRSYIEKDDDAVLIEVLDWASDKYS